jgi:HSP20 family protein
MVWRERFWQTLDRVKDRLVRIVRGTLPGFGAGGVSDQFLPGVFGGFPIDVSRDQDEIVVVADLPGAEQGEITIGLLSPIHLCITSTRRPGQPDPGEEGKIVRNERVVGPMHRVVALPHAVTVENGRASFNNGVLEVRLKTVRPERGVRIPIE